MTWQEVPKATLTFDVIVMFILFSLRSNRIQHSSTYGLGDTITVGKLIPFSLSLFRSLSAEIQSCLVSSGDVGCGTFQCFNNNSCEIQGLHHICLTLLHNAGRYDSQVGSSTTVWPHFTHSRHLKKNTFQKQFVLNAIIGPFALTDTVWNHIQQQLRAGLDRTYLDTCFYFI